MGNDNNQSLAPLLEVFAVFILGIALFQKLATEGMKILTSFERFFVSIWPVVFCSLVFTSVAFLLFCLGKVIFRKWKEHQRNIFDLHQIVKKKDEIIQSKNRRIEELLALISSLKTRNSRLKDGIARYHRLLTHLYPGPIMRSEKVNKKMEHTLANILQDFGSSFSDKNGGSK